MDLMRLLDLGRRGLGVPNQLSAVKTALARLHRQGIDSSEPSSDPRIHEFRAYSQFGEDGIIQYVLAHTADVPKRFVEFGSGDYQEATTRLLAELGGWSGFLMDSSPRLISRLRRDPILWRSQLTARSAFVSAENIDSLLTDAGFAREVGVLVLDIDGNEYWVWRAVESCRPTLVVIEYNALWGVDRSVTIPYRPDFDRFSAHWSGLYAGASIPLLVDLAAERGYRLVAVNSQANNAFFVRQESTCRLPTLAVQNWMGQPGFQQARDRRGKLTHRGDRHELRHILELPLIEPASGEVLTVGQVIGGRIGPLRGD